MTQYSFFDSKNTQWAGKWTLTILVTKKFNKDLVICLELGFFF